MPQYRIPLEVGRTYHIWTHANGSENLFRCENNFEYFLERYRYHIHPVVETFAYCLMPSHLHLMVRVRSEEELVEVLTSKKGKLINLQGLEDLEGLLNKFVNQQFSNLLNAYTKAYNKMYSRKGSLFIPRFNRKLITSDNYFRRLVAYIHNNPVHHGFVASPSEWRFSSWHAYLFEKNTHINKQETLKWFGSIENFELIHHELNQEKMKSVFEN